MKAQRNIITAMLFLLISSFSFSMHANEEARDMIVRITKLNGNTINIQLANLQQERTQVSIADLHGQFWFSEIITKEYGFAKQFDLSIIPTGTYIVYVRNAGEKHVKTFAKYKDDLAFFDTSNTTTSNQAFAQLTSSQAKSTNRLITRITASDAYNVDVQLANLLNKKAKIQLNQLGGLYLVKEQVSGKAGYAKTFNCLGLAKGDYYLLVQTQKSTLIQFFTINKDGIEMGEEQRLDGHRSNLSWATK